VARFPYTGDVGILIRKGIPTKGILSSHDTLSRIVMAFGNKHVELANKFSIENFSNYSYSFASKSGLMTNWVEDVLKKAKKLDLYGSMLMLGEGVFLFGEDLNYKVEKLVSKLESDQRPKVKIITGIDNYGVSEV
jgi:pantoate kinase